MTFFGVDYSLLFSFISCRTALVVTWHRSETVIRFRVHFLAVTLQMQCVGHAMQQNGGYFPCGCFCFIFVLSFSFLSGD
jgi:hypothetical protein